MLRVARRRGTLLVSALCFTVALGLSLSAHADRAAPCGVSLSPEDILHRLNEARAHGAACRPAGELTKAAPLKWSDSLAAAALLQSREMALLRRMGHRDSENRGLGERLHALGYRYSTAAENVAVGYPSLDDVVAAWLDSTGHCENLMNAAVLELGLACIDGSEGGPPEERRYWTLVLGAPARAR
ncbi:MAG: CAP domain-containing protein [Caldimonas sp.]